MIRIMILAFLFASYSFKVQKATIAFKKIPGGAWISIQDSLDHLVIKGEYVYDYYNKELISTTKYGISKTSCDATYKSPAKKVLFLTCMMACAAK